VASGCTSSKPKVAIVPATDNGDALPTFEMMENPDYKTWSLFPKGTIMRQRAITRSEKDAGETVTITTFSLVERNDEHVTITMKNRTVRYDGFRIDNPDQKVSIPRKVRLPGREKDEGNERPKPTVEERDEMIAIGGRVLKTRKSQFKDRNEAGEVQITTWTSDEVPAGLVRSVMRTPAVGKVTTIELIELTIPKTD
jgi:hypothetical protein